MHKEVDDTNDKVARRLIKFTTQNKILLNMLLRGNETLQDLLSSVSIRTSLLPCCTSI